MNIKELKKWYEEQCFREGLYAIGDEPKLFEGLGLMKEDNQFIWYFTERGQKQIIKTFENEEEACEFVYNEIKDNDFARTHFLAFADDAETEDEIINKLNKRKIEYKTDKIPYQNGVYKTRIFVIGCDYKKVADLKDKYK